jgi:hypothetical protein
MPIRYIVLSETNHYGWVGGFTTLTKANKMLKMETETFYIFKYVDTKREPFQMKIKYPIGLPYYDGLSINEYTEEVFEEDDDYVIITSDDTCDDGSLILTHKPYVEKVVRDVALKKETIKVSELRRNDMCIVKNKIYKIIAIWFAPTLTPNGLNNKLRFVLSCKEDKSEIERTYPHDFQLELDANSYVEMENI